MAEGLGEDVLRTFVAEWYDACLQGRILLVACLGFECKVACEGGDEGCGLRTVFHLYPGIHLTSEEDHDKPQSRLSRGTRDISVNLAALLPSRRYWSSDFMTSGDFGQHKFLPSRGAEGSPY